MVEYKILYSKEALKDAKNLSNVGLHVKAQKLIEILKQDPFRTPPSYEKLIGNLEGAYSRRINIKHRFVYQVRPEDRVVRILRMWSHYGE